MKRCCDHRICDHSNQMEGHPNKFTQLCRNISWKSLDQNNDWCYEFSICCVFVCTSCCCRYCCAIYATASGTWAASRSLSHMCQRVNGNAQIAALTSVMGLGEPSYWQRSMLNPSTPEGMAFLFILSASELLIQLRSRIVVLAARWIYYKVAAAEWTETLLSWVLL